MKLILDPEQGLEPNAQKKPTEGQLDLLKDCN